MTEFIPVSQEELRTIGTDLTGACWWCGGIGDSREHKVKRSILKKMWTPDRLDLVSDWEMSSKYTLHSPGSNAAKFSSTLCQRCNDTRSQPFDNAYEVFWDYIDQRVDALTDATSIDLADVYSDDWRHQALNLGRYALKSLGCRLAEDGIAPPQPWIDFLNGGPLLDTRIRLGRWEYMSLISRAFKSTKGDCLNCGTGHRGAAWWVNSSLDTLVHYEAVDFVNDITTHVSWSASSGVGEAFWDWKNTPLEIDVATEEQRAHAKQVASRLASEGA
jgi:hypothetical protein